ncbi:hypothetical protein [Pseudomonas fluorescens]|uniref:Uncharacterized protein n=1 Tax=Pseudomonas fluorescens TaxID=294 RepID=A0A5E7U535_PSEFL|nr:hypothetical protein [Pseudomonas fluorescens]VVQ05068.1 hypothetical protein PS928_02963 [Pseudomonas fluorescens]
MATVTFTDKPQAEARALIEVLTQWLDEQPEQPPVQGGKAVLEYADDDGNLRVVVVTVGES